MQFFGPSVTWQAIPNSTEFIDAIASTALTLPTLPTGQPPGAEYVGILTVQGAVAQYIRQDGQPAANTITGGKELQQYDQMVIEGRKNLEAVRIMRGAGGGAVMVEYWLFRPARTT